MGSRDDEIVFFDGGSYFAGPRSLLPDSLRAPDDGQAGTSELESEEADLLDAADPRLTALEDLVQAEGDEQELAEREARLRALRTTPAVRSRVNALCCCCVYSCAEGVRKEGIRREGGRKGRKGGR